MTCYHCGRVGHVAFQCRKKLFAKFLQIMGYNNKNPIPLLTKIKNFIIKMREVVPEMIQDLNLDLDMIIYLQKINNNKNFNYNTKTAKLLNLKKVEIIKAVFGVKEPENQIQLNEEKRIKKQKEEFQMQCLKNREKREERREQREVRREAREVARFNDYQANMIAKALEKKFEIQEQKRKLDFKKEKKEETDEQFYERKEKEIKNQCMINRGRYAPLYHRYQARYNPETMNEPGLLPDGAFGKRSGNVVGMRKDCARLREQLKKEVGNDDIQFLQSQGCVNPLIKKIEDLESKIQEIQTLQKDPTSGKTRNQNYQNRGFKKRRPRNRKNYNKNY